MARLRGHRDAPSFKGALVAPKIGVGRRKQRDVACAQVSLRPIRPADLQGADQARAQLGDGGRFRFALFLGVRIPLNVDCQFRGRRERQWRQLKGRREWYETRLARFLENALEHAIDVRNNFRAGSEIRSDSKQAAILGLCNDGLRERVGLHVSAAKAIDRLFGVTNQEQRAGAQDRTAPSLGLGLCGDAENDFRLHGVGILKLIDQQARIAAGEPGANIRILANQRARLPQQVIEVEDGGLALAPIVSVGHPG